MTVGLELTVERALEALQQPCEKPEPRAFGEPESGSDKEDIDEEDIDGEDIEEDDAGDLAPTGTATPGSRPQTGPKAVLADYREHQQRERLNRARETKELVEKIKKGAMVLTRGNGADETTKEDAEIEANNAALERYRQQRIQELMDERFRRQRQRPCFGTLRLIAVRYYVAEIDNEDPSVSVVIHLYEENIRACHILHSALDVLARRFGYAKFLRIPASEADSDFDRIALPAILVYRGGELVSNLMRVVEDDSIITPATIEQLLLQNGGLREQDRLNLTAAHLSSTYHNNEDDFSESD